MLFIQLLFFSNPFVCHICILAFEDTPGQCHANFNMECLRFQNTKSKCGLKIIEAYRRWIDELLFFIRLQMIPHDPAKWKHPVRLRITSDQILA